MSSPVVSRLRVSELRSSVSAWRRYFELIRALSCDLFIHMFSQREGASSHRQMGGLSCAHSTIFAWLNHVLHGSPLPEAADASIKQEVIELFRKSGGKEASLGAISLLQQAHLV